MNKQMQKQLAYRPEIDGLRALAVLSVVIYHLNENWLSGGFLGVDIFFVISGYLITRIITKEITDNTFSFKVFYQRRIKRIYPVFILIIVIASIFSSLFFIRSEGELLRKTIELAPIFATNFYLAHRQGYWDMGANENPLLHLWSLAVEEQYYLFFPILLFFVFKSQKQTSIFIKIVLGLFFLFLLTNMLPKSAYEKIGIYNLYYVSNLRFPELLIGSFIALLPISSNDRRNKLFCLFSFIGLLLCLFLYQKDIPYLVGIMILLPCTLSAILIYSLTSSNIIKKLLVLKPIVWIGKLSYSIYLFHWLFIALMHYITGQKVFSANTILLIVFATLFCSIMSYYWLEQPIRHSKLDFKKTVIFIYLIPSLVVIGYNQITKNSIKERSESIKTLDGVKVNLKPELNLPKIALIGDSHADHLIPFLTHIGNREQWQTVKIANAVSCHQLDAHYPPKKANCDSYFKEMAQYPIVFVSMFYNLKRGTDPLPRISAHEFKVKDFDQKFKAMISSLAKTKQVYVFADVKIANRSPTRALFLAKYGLDKFLDPIGELGNMQQSNEHLRQLIQDIPNVKFVDPTVYLPPAYFINDIPLYLDQDHLSEFGSLQMAKLFAEKNELISQEERQKRLK